MQLAREIAGAIARARHEGRAAALSEAYNALRWPSPLGVGGSAVLLREMSEEAAKGLDE